MKQYKILLPFVGIALFAIILMNIDLHQAADVIKRAQVSLLICGLLVIAVSFLLKVPRNHMIYSRQGIDIPFWVGANAYLKSSFWGFVSPARLGELSRPLYIGQYASKLKAVGNVLIDRILDVLTLVLFMLGGVVVTGLVDPLGWFAVGLIGCLAVVLWTRKYLERWLPTEGFVAKVVQALKNALWMERPFPVLVFTLFLWSINFFGIYCIAQSINIDFGVAQMIVVITSSYLIAFVPITIAGIGSRDALLIALFSLWGREVELAVVFSGFFVLSYLMLTLISYVIPFVVLDRVTRTGLSSHG